MRTGVAVLILSLPLLLAANGPVADASAREVRVRDIAAVDASARQVRIRDIASVEGVRANSLVGYGLIVGLSGTGDRQQTLFSTQTLGSILQRMGVQIPAGAVRVNNIAAVLVTSSLPPFARPGTQLDITVSSIGDAKSLDGGLLILTSLHGPDGQVYATAQGPVVLGGFSAGARGNTVQVNHPTTGRIPNGGIVERSAALDLGTLAQISLLLRTSDFQTAREVAAAINKSLNQNVARAVDGRRIEIKNTSPSAEEVTNILSQIESLSVTVHPPARVIINERTGTIVMGQNVSLGACSILHGNLAVEISTEFQVSQPPALSQGQTAVVPKTGLVAQESPARRIELAAGASVEDLISGLQGIGATARDIVAILEAIHAAGALHAELEII